jgi:hypothetical protein
MIDRKARGSKLLCAPATPFVIAAFSAGLFTAAGGEPPVAILVVEPRPTPLFSF